MVSGRQALPNYDTTSIFTIGYVRFTSIVLKNPLSAGESAYAVGRPSGADDLGLSALCGEDRRRKGDELRQFPQILGCGGQ